MRNPPTFEEVTATVTAVKRAAEMYELDPRFRALTQSCVAMARGEQGPVDHERPEQDAYEIAVRACMLLLARVYTEDAELVAIRAERDHYRRLAEKSLMLRPMPQIILKEQASQSA